MSDILTLTVDYRDVTFKVFCNGFPICDGNTEDTGFFSYPLNGDTVAGENLLRFEVSRRGPEGTLGFRIESHPQGSFVESGGEPQATLPDGDAPLSFEHRFASDDDAFGALLRDLRPSDEATMRDYALAVRDVFNAGDAAGVAALFEHKLRAAAASFGQPVEAMRQQMQGMVEELCKHRYPFEADDVAPVPYCDGRIWHLVDRDGKALIRIEDDEGTFALDMYAADTGDGLALVR